MKRNWTLLCMLLMSNAVFAQSAQERFIMLNKFFDIPVLLFGIYLLSVFILSVIKQILDHRLKQAMVEKGVSEELIKTFLQSNRKEQRQELLKWGIILIGAAAGFSIASFIWPQALFSVAAVLICIAISLLIYYRISRTDSQ